METKVCKCCGRELTEDNTSKAYKHLCKECYAAMVRNRRQQIGKRSISIVDWEHVRIKAAIAITTALSTVPYRTFTTTSGDTLREEYNSDIIVERAVNITDALVAKLKGGKE